MSKYNTDDRVLLIRYDGEHSCIIRKVSEPTFYKRYLIEMLYKKNPEGTPVLTWVSEDRLKKDVAYYRNKKLNQLL